jgi:hypothetical protein
MAEISAGTEAEVAVEHQEVGILLRARAIRDCPPKQEDRVGASVAIDKPEIRRDEATGAE